MKSLFVQVFLPPLSNVFNASIAYFPNGTALLFTSSGALAFIFVLFVSHHG